MENNLENQPELKVGESLLNDFKEIGKWAGFLAVVGFVLLALMIVLSFRVFFISGPMFSGMDNSALPKAFIFILYIIFVVIYFFPTYFLFCFADLLRKAVRRTSEDDFARSVSYLKSFFIYLGILTIIFSVVMLVSFMIGLSMGRMF